MDHPSLGSGLQDVNASMQQPDLKIGDISFCATPADTTKPVAKRRNTAGKESLGSMIQHGIVQHQLGISLNLVFLLALAYAFFPSLRHNLDPFFRLQYPQSTGKYGAGPNDLWIILGCVVFFTGLRAFMMDYVLTPLAQRCGVKKGKARARFAEQSYLLTYYIFFWTVGMKLVIEDTPTITATTTSGAIDQLLHSVWHNWPRMALTQTMKAYYLAQTAFWIQQVLVIHLEERRKDHWQMLTHHFITIGLLVFSYGGRHTRPGNVILVLMDFVDLVFPLAKCLRYVGLQTACDFCFGVFVLSWVFSRHVAYCAVLYSLYVHGGSTTLKYGTYSTATAERLTSNGGTNILDNLLQPFLNPTADTVQFNPPIRSLFLMLLGGLQVITCIWFVMIVKVVIRVLSGEGADDSRSDDEGEEEEEEENVEEEMVQEKSNNQKYIEVTADAEDLYYAASRNASIQRLTVTRRKSKGISSGLNFGEHKEILNRIGCLSEEQLARERERRRESNSPQPGSSKRA